jgi:tetratricopeptide (TPR) repeat protein
MAIDYQRDEVALMIRSGFLGSALRHKEYSAPQINRVELILVREGCPALLSPWIRERSSGSPTFAVSIWVRCWKHMHNRGSVKIKLGRYEEAIDDFSTAIELNPRFGRAFAYRSGAREKLGQKREAAADYAEAIRLDPELGQRLSPCT